MSNLKSKMKTYSFWISLVSAVLIIIRILGEYFGWFINEKLIMDIVTGICGVLVLLGILSSPTKGEETVENTIDQIKQEVENSSQEQKELQSQIKEDLSESNLTIAEQIEKLKSKIAELSQTEQNITQVCESLVEEQPAAIEEVGNQETQPLVEVAAEQAGCAEVCLAEETLATVQTTEVEAKEEVSTETFVISLGEEELDFSSFSTQQIKELVLKLLERL